jgi:DNA polymerase-3 subunit delta'
MTEHTPIRRVEGHDQIIERFQNSLRRGRLSSGYLFVGPVGIGKRALANWLAQALLCETTSPRVLDPCGSCPSCRQVAAGTHPDFDVVEKPADKATIPVDLLIGDKNHRMREGLCARVAMSSSRGGRKIAIIDDADFLSQEAANCLLKTLEEPPPQAVLILIGSSAQRQLPTIRSRCQIVSFAPLQPELTKRLILQQGIADNDKDAARLANACGGSLAKATELRSPEIWEFYDRICQTLGGCDWQPPRLAKAILDFVEAAGKEATRRRARQILVMELVADFYRQVMHAHAGSTVLANREEEEGPHAAIANCVVQWPHSSEALAACVDRCLLACQHVAANANQATNVEAWVDDLWRLNQHGMNVVPFEYAVN